MTVENVTARPVVAICTSRLDDVEARWQDVMDHLEGAEFFVLFDGPVSERGRALAERIAARGGTVQWHGVNRGLSAARNSVLDAFSDRRVLFVDDDLRLVPGAVTAISAAFAAGAHVVGARLVPPHGQPPWPWFFTVGQMHLVGWHPAVGPIKIWGACMGIDAAFAQRHRLRFDGLLGRTGRRLESGDDTSFVAAMKAAGAREQLLANVYVVHDVDPARVTLRYLVRRAYWQGRSEVRRGQPAAGLRKEWCRHRSGCCWPLAAGYLGACAIGVGWELVWQVIQKRDRRVTPRAAPDVGPGGSMPEGAIEGLG